MRIDVTQKNIDDGKPNSLKCCMVALALSEHFDDVRCGYTLFRHSGNSEGVELPDIAARNTVNFDNNIPVEPFSFDLNYKQSANVD